MPASNRRRRKRRAGEYRAPATRRETREARAEAGSPTPAAPTRRRPRHPERPPAPWGSFPLVEIVILVALVLLLTGFFISGTRGTVMILAGVSLASLAGLELVLREHFAGYRSHSSVLAGSLAVVALGVGFWLAWPPALQIGVAVVVFLVSFYLFREAFKRRSGGVGFR
jgi:hypothetical protein